MAVAIQIMNWGEWVGTLGRVEAGGIMSKVVMLYKSEFKTQNRDGEEETVMKNANKVELLGFWIWEEGDEGRGRYLSGTNFRF
jgi:hypothetical protein